jgi:uncharacterized membrane protein
MRPLRLVAWGIVVAMFVVAALTFAGAGERVAVHANAAGTVDRWAPKSLVSVFLLPAGAAVVVALLALVGAQSARRPELLNIPDKDKLVRLPARYRAPVLVRVLEMMDAAAVVVALTFGLIQWEFTRVAASDGSRVNVLVLIAPMFLTVGLLLFVSRITTALEEADRAWRAAGSPPE